MEISSKTAKLLDLYVDTLWMLGQLYIKHLEIYGKLFDACEEDEIYLDDFEENNEFPLSVTGPEYDQIAESLSSYASALSDYIYDYEEE